MWDKNPSLNRNTGKLQQPHILGEVLQDTPAPISSNTLLLLSHNRPHPSATIGRGHTIYIYTFGKYGPPLGVPTTFGTKSTSLYVLLIYFC